MPLIGFLPAHPDYGRAHHMTRRTTIALTLAFALLAALSLTTVGAAPLGPVPAGAATATPLTNLAHLDWLGDTITPPAQADHTTYRLAEEPSLSVLWTYADLRADGTYKRLGGGLQPDGTYTQGAFNADDLSRAAVVYLRHWRLTGSTDSRRHAHGLLRALTYLQTAAGPNIGNVVLWMQPDGTLNPSATPVELPDPSDSDAAYWLARTIWALGEGYADFRTSDPAFAAFLRARLDLAIAAVDREVLDAYGTFHSIDGKQVPAWLIADGGDASSEAMLGLAAYVDAGGGAAARDTLRKLARGVAMLAGGDARSWPFGAVLPWAMSLSEWHAWGADMPSGLARAGQALGDPSLVKPAVADSAIFTPWLLTSGGPDNGRLPTRSDDSQIAYGADARVEGLFATADAAGRPGLRTLAGVAASWFFGANPAGVATYDPATGITFDGISADGVVNHNSGAESTIHGLLTMLALDAHPMVAPLARTATIRERVGTTTLQAEDATLTGGATAVAAGGTGESQYGGTGYAALANGGSAAFTLPAGLGRSVVLPVVNLQPGSTAVTTVRTGDGSQLGRVASGNIGAQGDSAAPGALLPVTLPKTLAAGESTLTATAASSGTDTAMLDAMMLEPAVSRFVLGSGDHATALLRSADTSATWATVAVPGHGKLAVEVYDSTGALRERSQPGSAGTLTVNVHVLAGGFTLVRR
jgi:hypothetical protein